MSISNHRRGGRAVVVHVSLTPDKPNVILPKAPPKLTSDVGSDGMVFESSNPSICSAELNVGTFDASKSCVPKKEMNEAVSEGGYTSIDDASKDLQCTSTGEGSEDAKDLCILERMNDRKRVVKYFKTPVKSISPNYWINNSEIDTVQYQLSDLFDGYYYSNIHMIDFGMFSPDDKDVMPDIKPLKQINFVNELTGSSDKELTHDGEMKWFGVVANTDVSSGRGQHWFAIFMDFSSTPCTIEYFNSSGYDIRNHRFKQWFINLADDITRAGKSCKYIRVTEIQHQMQTTANCGAYSMYYIWSRLNGVPYDWFGKNKVPDSRMELFRKYVFRHNS